MLKIISSFIFMIYILLSLSSFSQAQYVQISDANAYQFHKRFQSINKIANEKERENVSVDDYIKAIGSDSTYDKYAFTMRNNASRIKNDFAVIGLSSNKMGCVSRIMVLAQRNTIGARCIGFACKRILFKPAYGKKSNFHCS